MITKGIAIVAVSGAAMLGAAALPAAAQVCEICSHQMDDEGTTFFVSCVTPENHPGYEDCNPFNSSEPLEVHECFQFFECGGFVAIEELRRPEDAAAWVSDASGVVQWAVLSCPEAPSRHASLDPRVYTLRRGAGPDWTSGTAAALPPATSSQDGWEPTG